jgi:hypothetical protein
MDDSNHEGTVRLTVPAYPEFVRVVRLTAAGALSLGAYSMRFVDDVRAALSEACALVIGDVGHPGTLDARLEIDGDRLWVEVCGEFADPPTHDAAADRLSERLLEPLVDQYEIDLGRDRVQFSKVHRD